jgi:hypothetical protein
VTPVPAARRAAAALALAILTAGCASTSGPAKPAGSGSPAAPLSLASAVTGPGATWAAVPMGAASGANQFWQLFLLPAGSSQWSLQTPPDIATNGALLLAGQPGQGVIVGERPSLSLTFSAITTTRDGGRTWATLPPAAGLSDVPDALAAAPDGRLLALGGNQQVTTTGPAGNWATLTTGRALAATPAARNCGLTGLTAAAYTPAGSPLLAGACSRPGVTGIFASAGGTWQLAGPALPASLAGQQIRVLRLSRAGGQDVALLQAGTGTAASLLAAWTSDGGQHWQLSAPLGLDGTNPVSVSFGAGGAAAVVLGGNRGETLAGPGVSWHALPPLPAGHAITLAMPAAGITEALAASGTRLTVWRLTSGPAAWVRTQAITVPIQYGSSG